MKGLLNNKEVTILGFFYHETNGAMVVFADINGNVRYSTFYNRDGDSLFKIAVPL